MITSFHHPVPPPQWRKVRSAGLEAGAVRGLQALRATLLTAVEAARDGELQEVRPVAQLTVRRQPGKTIHSDVSLMFKVG